MKWNKQRAAGPPLPAPLSPSRPAGLLPAAVFDFSKDKNREWSIYRGGDVSAFLL